MWKNWTAFGVAAVIGQMALFRVLMPYSRTYVEMGFFALVLAAAAAVAIWQAVTISRQKRYRNEYLASHGGVASGRTTDVPSTPVWYLRRKRKQAIAVSIVTVVLWEAAIELIAYFGHDIMEPALPGERTAMLIAAAMMAFAVAPLCLAARYLGKKAEWKWLTVLATIVMGLSLLFGVVFGLYCLL